MVAQTRAGAVKAKVIKSKLALKRSKVTRASSGGKIREPQFLSVLLKRRKNPGAMKRLIDLADKNEVDAISEIVLNAYRGNIQLSPTLIKQLGRNRRAAQRLINKNVSLLEKKKILKTKQVGGFIGAILGSLAGLVLKPLLGHIVGRITRGRKR